MRLKRIEIDNYKSLRGVVMEPGPLSVLVGANAAGKTNFCEALDFLARVYQWNLEEAVANKGGYENICYRDGYGRSKDPIRFRVVLELPAEVTRDVVVVDHSFEFGTARTGASSFFSILSEELTMSLSSGDVVEQAVGFSRRGKQIKVDTSIPEKTRALSTDFLMEIVEQGSNERQLALESILPVLAVVWQPTALKGTMGRSRIFQISALGARSQGVATPNPSLERFGGNLPAVILHLKRNCPEEYAQILSSLKRVLPDVEELDASVTHARTLVLSVQRGEAEQSWPAEDLSDGTIQAIATLAATFDPRIPLLVLEEPENNVHPWAIRAFAEAFRLASETKQIILTTHSPILIDQFKPEELWIVQKPGTTTRIDPLLTLDPSLKESWERGRFTLSEYLDSGALPQAVPAIAS